MILRKFMTHVSDQNWFAVGLDVLVVITGIFIGMQVTEWNEVRKSNVVAKQTVTQLISDTKKAISNNDEEIEIRDALLLDWKLVLSILDGATLEPDQKASFERGMEQIYQTDPPNLEIGLLARIISGDRLNLQPYPIINQAILNFESSMKYNLNVFDHILELLLISTSTLGNYIGFNTYQLSPNVKITYDLKKIKNSQEFRYAFQNAMVAQDACQVYAKRNRKALMELLVKLETYS